MKIYSVCKRTVVAIIACLSVPTSYAQEPSVKFPVASSPREEDVAALAARLLTVQAEIVRLHESTASRAVALPPRIADLQDSFSSVVGSVATTAQSLGERPFGLPGNGVADLLQEGSTRLEEIREQLRDARGADPNVTGLTPDEQAKLEGLEEEAASLNLLLKARADYQVLEATCGNENFIDVELSPIFKDKLKQFPTDSIVKTQWPVVSLRFAGSSEIRTRLPGFTNGGSHLGQRFCSGTLIAGARILTAAHCVRATELARNGVSVPSHKPDGRQPTPAELSRIIDAELFFQVDASDCVNVNVTNCDFRDTITLSVKNFVEEKYLNNGLDADFALLELDISSVTLPTGGALAVAPLGNATTVGERIAVIQHPNQSPKKVDAGHITTITGAVLSYDNIDTLGGSSGAGIFNESGGLVGVHTRSGKLGICTLQNGNRGLSIAAAREVLDNL